jgi:hypothetical protein
MLDRILSRTELKEFTTVIDQAVSQGAGAARYYSEASGVIVIAILANGGIETWFASPARNNVEAYAAQAIVLHGLAQASEVLAGLLSGASTFASEAIRKAAH